MTNKQLNTYWDKVIVMAEKYGYSCVNHNDVTMGTGSVFYNHNDSFTPIINLVISRELNRMNPIVPASILLLVEDRNGTNILNGPNCAVNVLKDCEDFDKRLEEMCKYVFDKYSHYSKKNRLDFIFRLE